MTESSTATVAPLLLRNLLTSIFIYADSYLLNVAEKFKLLQVIRYFIVSAFLFFLRILPSFFPSLSVPSVEKYNYPLKPPKAENYRPAAPSGSGGVAGAGDSGIARALSQLLSIANDIPVSSRKYEVVRSLTETIINENLREKSETLREITCMVLSAAFSRTLGQLDAAVLDRGRVGGDDTDGTREGEYYRVNRVLGAVRYYRDAVWPFGRPRGDLSRSRNSAEKLAAELLWLAQNLAACCGSEEAVSRWASASNLAWLALSAEPRLQGPLVKVSAFLLKEAKVMGSGEGKENNSEEQRQTKMKLLMSWLPLLCRANSGTDTPVLSVKEKAELECVLEEIIESLDIEEEQEKVLSLWLHYFTHCPSSDWPNLHSCYARWCTASRRLMLVR